MDPAEVFAVEIKQYVGQDLRTLVPRVIGQTVKAQQTKSESPRAKRQWNEQSFFQELEMTRGAAEAAVARRILQWALDTHLRIWWGQGKQYGSFFPLFDYGGTTHWLVSVWTSGTAEVQFQMMQTKPPFDDEPRRQELRRRLNDIPGVAIPADAVGRRPSIRLVLLTNEAALNQLLQSLDWVIEEIKATK